MKLLANENLTAVRAAQEEKKEGGKLTKWSPQPAKEKPPAGNGDQISKAKVAKSQNLEENLPLSLKFRPEIFTKPWEFDLVSNIKIAFLTGCELGKKSFLLLFSLNYLVKFGFFFSFFQ